MTNSEQNLSPDSIPELIFIPAGPFWMGSEINDSAAHDNEKPRQEHLLGDFKIGRYPITNAQYAVFVEETNHLSPWENQTPPTQQLDHPVTNVSYYDAEAYCLWLSQATGILFRLPTEYEWEKAARGPLPNNRRYTWDVNDTQIRCNTKESGNGGTTPVTRYKDLSASPFGVADLLGNVWEWTEDWYGRYPESPHDSLLFGRTHKVVRGGSWSNPLKRARISCRARYKPDEKRPYLGFRAAVDVIAKHDKPIYLQNTLFPLLKQSFDTNELQMLCYELGINYQNLSNHHDKLAMELIQTCQRLGKIEALIELCRKKRPNTKWRSEE